MRARAFHCLLFLGALASCGGATRDATDAAASDGGGEGTTADGNADAPADVIDAASDGVDDSTIADGAATC